MEPLSTRYFEGFSLQAHEDARLIFGFTHSHFAAATLQRFFQPLPLVFLKQVHSSRIIQASGRQSPSGRRKRQQLEEADGILLTTPGTVAVIQTADCVPLFFYADDCSAGGVIHVGWRGLQAGIEEKLVARLGAESDQFNFYLGPGIEKKCYEVGEELPPLFRGKAYGERIFVPLASGKYSLDIKAGLAFSLQAAGIAAGRIRDSGLCTFCSHGRFPSYRRDGKTGKRIFNFLLLKSRDPAPV